MNAGELQTNVVPMPRGVYACFTGILTYETYLLAERALEEGEQQHTGPLLIDLEEVSFFDSQGLRLLITAWQRAVASGRKLAIVAPRPPANRVLQVTRVDERLPVYASLADALRSLQPTD